MQMICVAIKDRALNAFMRPFFAQTKNQAIRIFNDEINNNQSPMFNHPDDYDLYYLAAWDDSTGEFKNAETPEQLAIGKNGKIT